MIKKLKFTNVLLATAIILIPFANLNNNISQAKEVSSVSSLKSNDTQKYIDYIDSQIHLENNKLIINKMNVLNYIKNNFKEININNNFSTPEQYYNTIEASINKMNEKVNSGWYKFNNDNSVTEKYKNKSAQRYEQYEKWWGFQFYARYQYQVNDLTDDIETVAYTAGAVAGVASFFTGPAAAAFGLVGLNYGWMKVKVERTYRDNGSVKLSINRFTSIFWTEPIK